MTAEVFDRPASAFDLAEYLQRFDTTALLKSAEYRRTVSKVDPLAFALIYLPHHLRSEQTGDQITLSEFHVDMAMRARQWIGPNTEPMQMREIDIAPRSAGKSTWRFLILPMWAAAHGWRKFIAAFAHTATQAEYHLMTFKRELETNVKLMHDFPDLCTPGRRPTGVSIGDRQNMYVSKPIRRKFDEHHGYSFVFTARGIDSTTLGMKIADRRPDLIILDDIEPPEETYTAEMKEKRLIALQDSILPLNIYAAVSMVGTVTMPDSIVHDAVRVRTTTDPPADWIDANRFTVFYYPAILDNGDGTRRSLWPQFWPLSFLEAREHTREYRKNYANDPMGIDGQFWNAEDFTYGMPDSPITHQIISVDPAITETKRSDYTAVGVIGYAAGSHQAVVQYAEARRWPPGEAMRQWLLELLEQFPQVRAIFVETNQGGDTWKSIFHDMPVRVFKIHNSEQKEVRAARALAHYQRIPTRVFHAQPFAHLEGQMVGFPKAPHDDLVDMVGNGLDVLLKPRKKAGARTVQPR